MECGGVSKSEWRGRLRGSFKLYFHDTQDPNIADKGRGEKPGLSYWCHLSHSRYLVMGGSLFFSTTPNPLLAFTADGHRLSQLSALSQTSKQIIRRERGWSPKDTFAYYDQSTC